MKNNIEVFEKNVAEYEEWFERYPFVFQSEINAVREVFPEGDSLSGIEIGLGTGRYSQELNIKEGIEPSANMRAIANQRGIETMDAVAENLPYADMRFDFVLMLFNVSYFNDIRAAFKEAYRVLKRDGCLIVGFLEKNSLIGKYYEKREDSDFYRQASFYTVNKITDELKSTGFRHLEYNQTLFGELNSITAIQPVKKGFGQGSFVVVKAMKQNPA